MCTALYPSTGANLFITETLPDNFILQQKMFLVPALLVGTTAFLGAAPPAPPSPGVDILSTVFYEGLGGISCKQVGRPHALKKITCVATVTTCLLTTLLSSGVQL